MKTKSIDYAIFFAILALIVFGMIMISSVSVYPSYRYTSLKVAAGLMTEPNNYYYLVHNLTSVAMSVFLFVLVIKFPYTLLEKYAKYFFYGSVASLIMVLIIGATYNGATWWIDLPGLPSIQPVEFVKIALVIFFAYFLKKKRNEIATFQWGFLPYMMLLGVIMLLLGLQPDFGSILLIVPVVMILFFIGGGNIKHLAVSGLVFALFAGGIYGIGKMASSWEPEAPKASIATSEKPKSVKGKLSYISNRIDNFLSDNQTSIQNNTVNYQTKQGLIAIGSGGFFGLWFWKSIEKFGYLPEVQGDFIFSVIAEELGFAWVLVLVSVYGFIIYRGLRIARLVDDPFGKYIAIGLTSGLAVQVFVNMGVNLNIVPLTGVTLPFVSYGGSSLMALLVGMGILLNISRHAKYEDTNRRGTSARRFS